MAALSKPKDNTKSSVFKSLWLVTPGQTFSSLCCHLSKVWSSKFIIKSLRKSTTESVALSVTKRVVKWVEKLGQPSSKLWRRVVWYKLTDVSEEIIATIFYHANGGSRFFRTRLHGVTFHNFLCSVVTVKILKSYVGEFLFYWLIQLTGNMAWKSTLFVYKVRGH